MDKRGTPVIQLRRIAIAKRVKREDNAILYVRLCFFSIISRAQRKSKFSLFYDVVLNRESEIVMSENEGRNFFTTKKSQIKSKNNRWAANLD